LKMDFIFSGLFWGVIIILLGLSVILNAAFHIHIPLFRIIIGLILIYFGIKFIAGPSWHGKTPGNMVLFSDSKVTMNDDKGEINVLFSRATIDTAAAANGAKINTIFGASTIKVSKDIPTIISIETAFGGVRMPDGNTVSFGNYTYKNKACETAADSVPRKTIKLDVVFGGAEIVEQ
jgi:hypothetical protein